MSKKNMTVKWYAICCHFIMMEFAVIVVKKLWKSIFKNVRNAKRF